MGNEIQLIPFGKYKDQPLEILLEDTNYVEWIQTQNWVKEKYIWLFKAIERAEKLNETPEHNGFQLRFLSKEYRELVANKYLDYFNAKHKNKIRRTVYDGNAIPEKYTKMILNEAGLDINKIEFLSTYWPYSHLDSEQLIGFILLDKRSNTHRVLEALVTIDGECYIERDDQEISERNIGRLISIIPEVRVSDIRFEEPMYSANNYGKVEVVGSADVEFDIYGTCIPNIKLCVEIKPVISEDYMTILRKAKKSQINMVMCDRLDSDSATLVQLKEVFGRDGICFLCSNEL